MSGLHASVPEHVLSAIGELEHAFRTGKNTRLTIEDATVRVQNGAMQYMLGQARRLHFSPVHLAFARAPLRARLPLTIVASVLSQSNVWTSLATRVEGVSWEILRCFGDGSFTICQDGERGGRATRTRRAAQSPTAKALVPAASNERQDDEDTPLGEGGDDAAAEAEPSTALVAPADAQDEVGAGAEAAPSSPRAPPRPADRDESQSGEGIYDDNTNERLLGPEEAMEMADAQARTIFEPYGLGHLHAVLQRSVVLERELHEAVEATKAEAEAARANREQEEQVQTTLKAAEYMRDRGEELARSGLDAQSVMAQCLEMAKAALSSAAGSGIADAAETPAEVDVENQIAQMRKKRKAVLSAVDRLQSSVEDGEQHLKVLKASVPEEAE